MNNKKSIVIFASGSGSNALNLINYFNNSDKARVNAIFVNNISAGVIQKALNNQVAIQTFKRNDFYDTNNVINWVNTYQPDIIVLAGFLWLVPESFITYFNDRIINLHPSLLPKFGGKGMFGKNVHQAVIDAQETESGITIHKVSKEYDKGEILCQVKFSINPDDDVATLESKIHELEFIHLPRTIENLIA